MYRQKIIDEELRLSGDILSPLDKEKSNISYFSSFFRTASAGTSPITKGTIQVNNR